MNSKIAAFFFLVSLAVFCFFFSRNRRLAREKLAAARKPKPSAVLLALKNLRLARQQISVATSREFSQLLSDALRTYTHSAYKLPSSIATTEEIIDKLLSDATNDWQLISLLSEILKLTDSVKFSRRKLSIPQQNGLYGKACRFVLLSERIFRKRKTTVT
ncbi:MAG: hypothetical protein LBB18_02730 [Puniceicoccales bacterium]|nr:hypothetical protein [Puniceicoccales bacterium]